MNLKTRKQRASWEQLAYMVISFALSYLAGRLLAKKSGLKVDDDKPTTLTTRGSFMNFVLGRRRVGPLFAWAGEREHKKESAGGGGKGSPSPKVEVFYESGWHVLASNGPVFALHQIIQSGGVIFDGPITSDSHPSGTTVDLGKEGAFTIYWGEQNQPINAFLGGAGRVGVTSRWPFTCYIVWNKKRLGQSPNWPVVEYVIDRRPQLGLLTQSQSYYEPTRTLTGATAPIFSHVNGVEGTGHFQFGGDITSNFRNGKVVKLTGNALADGDYTIFRSEVVLVVIGTDPEYGTPIYATRTNIYFYGGLTTTNDLGQIQAYVEAEDDGLNPAHIIAEMLFAEFPQGVTCDTGGDEPWDLDSLEALGVDAETDGIRSSYVGIGGETAAAGLAAFMQDYGFLLPIDTSTGKLKFQMIREPVGTLPVIAVSAQVTNLPEIETLHGERAVDKLVFKFADRTHSFGDMTIAIDDDGQAIFEENQRSRIVEIPTTVHFDTAAKIAERRSQEELAGASVVDFAGARGARQLIPGQPVLIDGVDEVMRVVGLKVDPLSSAVALKTIADYYGVRKSDFVNLGGGGTTTFQPVAPDLLFDIVEVPEYLLAGGAMTIVIPRIRAHNQIVNADLWISRDNTTYQLSGTELNVQTGGTLAVQLNASDDSYLPLGPTITALGPDISTVLDLSADDTNWLLGRQLCIIIGDNGTEICFLQNVTALGGSTYRLDGLVRSRYDTQRLTHPIGSKVFILQNTSIEFIQDILLIPNEDLSAKTQPLASSGQISLATVPPRSIVLHGKGVKPMDPIALHVTAPVSAVPAYATGQDASFKWGYRSTALPKTGAGMQGAGVSTAVSPVVGQFTVELLTIGNVVKRSFVQAGTTYLYTNANLVTDFAGEPASYKVRVTLKNGGFSSEPLELVITKV